MKTLINKRRKLPIVLFAVVLALSAAISCSKDDGGYGNDMGGNNNGGTNTVKIQNYAFSPSTITVKAGTTLKWTNYDAVAHTVTSDDGLFDSGLIDQNASFSQTFDSTGTFDYHCTPHPTMKASVVVN
jgi:plastocyanin